MPLPKKHRSRPKTWGEKLYETLIIRSWWVLCFLAICYFFHAHAMQNKEQVRGELMGRLHSFEGEKERALMEREDLMLQINSQSDPSWIQMTLMKGLGVVPEGQTKVYFKKDEP